MKEPKDNSKKTIPCVKCRNLPAPLEACPACKGTGKLVLSKIAKKKEPGRRDPERLFNLNN